MTGTTRHRQGNDYGTNRSDGETTWYPDIHFSWYNAIIIFLTNVHHFTLGGFEILTSILATNINSIVVGVFANIYVLSVNNFVKYWIVHVFGKLLSCKRKNAGSNDIALGDTTHYFSPCRFVLSYWQPDIDAYP